MNAIHIQYCKTTIGNLILGCFQNRLCMLDFRDRKTRSTIDKRIKQGLNADFIERDHGILQKTRQQIAEYLSGHRKQFDIPIWLVGSDFQKQVWQQLLRLNYGQTASYLTLAKKINNEKAVRALASANGANALALIIPCHRIIQSNGGLGGYSGGLSVKKRLLEIEASQAPSHR